MLDRKFDSDIERDYVKMLWENCVPVQLCKFVYLKDNFTQLCQLQITFQKTNDIVKNFIEQDKTNIELLRQHLQQHAVTNQYLYTRIYTRDYIRAITALEYTINLFLSTPTVIGIFKKKSINNQQEKIRLMAAAAAKITAQK